MNVHGFKRDFFHEVQAHHNHSGDPEENDVKARHQHVCRIITRQFRRFVGPAQRRERPQSRRKPSVEHVFVAFQFDRFAVMLFSRCQSRRFAFFNKLFAVGSVPHGHLMPPPQLAGNAPRLKVAHPFKIRFFPVFRHEFDSAVFNDFNRLDRQFRRVNKPLIRQPRLDHHARTVAVRDCHRIVFNFNKQSQFFDFI